MTLRTLTEKSPKLPVLGGSETMSTKGSVTNFIRNAWFIGLKLSLQNLVQNSKVPSSSGRTLSEICVKLLSWLLWPNNFFACTDAVGKMRAQQSLKRSFSQRLDLHSLSLAWDEGDLAIWVPVANKKNIQRVWANKYNSLFTNESWICESNFCQKDCYLAVSILDSPEHSPSAHANTRLVVLIFQVQDLGWM